APTSPAPSRGLRTASEPPRPTSPTQPVETPSRPYPGQSLHCRTQLKRPQSPPFSLHRALARLPLTPALPQNPPTPRSNGAPPPATSCLGASLTPAVGARG